LVGRFPFWWFIQCYHEECVKGIVRNRHVFLRISSSSSSSSSYYYYSFHMEYMLQAISDIWIHSADFVVWMCIAIETFTVLLFLFGYRVMDFIVWSSWTLSSLHNQLMAEVYKRPQQHVVHHCWLRLIFIVRVSENYAPLPLYPPPPPFFFPFFFFFLFFLPPPPPPHFHKFKYVDSTT